MSTEHENSLVAMPQPETVVISCSICHEPLVDNDSQLSCTCENCAKSVCAECLERLIRVVFNQPTLSYPFRCLSCACLLDQRVLEDMITKRDDYEKFIACVLPLFWSKACLEDNEQLASCKYQRPAIDREDHNAHYSNRSILSLFGNSYHGYLSSSAAHLSKFHVWNQILPCLSSCCRR